MHLNCTWPVRRIFPITAGRVSFAEPQDKSDGMAVVSRAKQFARDLAARAIAPFVRRLAHDPKYSTVANYSFHFTAVCYYQRIPDTRSLALSIWNRVSDLPGVDMREDLQKQLLAEILPRFKDKHIAVSAGGISYNGGVPPASFWFRQVRQAKAAPLQTHLAMTKVLFRDQLKLSGAQ
jgi:hypothetical protein